MRSADADHPFIAAIVERFDEIGEDGVFSSIAFEELDALLQPLVREPLADALWNALVFGQFFEAKFQGEGVAAQLLELVEKHALRLPRELQSELQASRDDVIGAARSLKPVGAEPTPQGSVRGGLNARFEATKKP